ncbi:phytoene/squalene synthase family protein [Thermospira aquatica]|uniref:Phytoene/squalene synthase family protein n=1 Tax=Thermospira aquatica TaxID=2828656 RepID=A0AAX3BCH5_9SPIR|nr:phytoene/squalene synthase family protein [Thermospira aquatica]URA09989.1 phytoene/squalene synthase family protein [Thermospira aquatica]
MTEKEKKLFSSIFQKGSKTYFNSSLFFPKTMREQVFRLYAFVRVADNYVDAIPQQKEAFYQFKHAYLAARQGTPSQDPVIDSFVRLSQELGFPDEWADAFLAAMEEDLSKHIYHTLDETCEYMYGSAEVIGFFMSRIMMLPEEAYPYAALLGRAMQYINFIRDIAEDLSFGRIYLPLDESPFPDLKEETCRKNPSAFEQYIRRQIFRYLEWQNEAQKGYQFIPKKMLIPIKTAADMYAWTARKIFRNPWIVYKRKVKPPKWRILVQVLWNTLSL